MRLLITLFFTATLLLAGGSENDKFISSKLSDSVDLGGYQEPKKQQKSIKVHNDSQRNGIYNYSYSPNQKYHEGKNIFLEGYFDKIERFAPLYFEGEHLNNDSKKTLEQIEKKIHSYIDDKSREIVVSIIGYTQGVENNVTDINLDTAYTNFFQKVAQRDDLDVKNADKSSQDQLQSIYDKLVDDNISKDILYTEKRVGKDELYTEEFSEGREKNDRVAVAIYVKNFVDPDSDLDGIHDSKDYCPDTPLGSKVDKNGCPYIMTLDLKFDFDKATISTKKSLDDIQKLSSFMKKYPVYHANIVGHTDSKGSKKYNQKLSLRRAKSVKNMLVKDGVDASRISYEGRGESEPLVENINPFNRHKNRRTEVELTLPASAKKELKIKPRTRSK